MMLSPHRRSPSPPARGRWSEHAYGRRETLFRFLGVHHAHPSSRRLTISEDVLLFARGNILRQWLSATEQLDGLRACAPLALATCRGAGYRPQRRAHIATGAYRLHESESADRIGRRGNDDCSSHRCSSTSANEHTTVRSLRKFAGSQCACWRPLRRLAPAGKVKGLLGATRCAARANNHIPSIETIRESCLLACVDQPQRGDALSLRARVGLAGLRALWCRRWPAWATLRRESRLLLQRASSSPFVSRTRSAVSWCRWRRGSRPCFRLRRSTATRCCVKCRFEISLLIGARNRRHRGRHPRSLVIPLVYIDFHGRTASRRFFTFEFCLEAILQLPFDICLDCFVQLPTAHKVLHQTKQDHPQSDQCGGIIYACNLHSWCSVCVDILSAVMAVKSTHQYGPNRRVEAQNVREQFPLSCSLLFLLLDHLQAFVNLKFSSVQPARVTPVLAISTTEQALWWNKTCKFGATGCWCVVLWRAHSILSPPGQKRWPGGDFTDPGVPGPSP